MFLKSILHLSLGNAVTCFDKNIVIVWLKHIFIQIFCAIYTVHIKNTHLKQNRNKSKNLFVAKISHSIKDKNFT